MLKICLGNLWRAGFRYVNVAFVYGPVLFIVKGWGNLHEIVVSFLAHDEHALISEVLLDIYDRKKKKGKEKIKQNPTLESQCKLYDE